MKYFDIPEPERETDVDIEAAMRKTSLVVSIVALALMVGGLLQFNLFGPGPTVNAGYSVVPLAQFIHPLNPPLGLLAMSTGVILLCLLPAVRVVLALWAYVREKCLFDALIALLVLLELVFGMQAGR